MISLLLFLQFLQEFPGKIVSMSRLNKHIIRRLTKPNIVPRKQKHTVQQDRLKVGVP